jgi:hypothetical protein
VRIEIHKQYPVTEILRKERKERVERLLKEKRQSKSKHKKDALNKNTKDSLRLQLAELLRNNTLPDNDSKRVKTDRTIEQMLIGIGDVELDEDNLGDHISNFGIGERLRREFKYLDVDQDGVISYDDLRIVCADLFGVDQVKGGKLGGGAVEEAFDSLHEWFSPVKRLGSATTVESSDEDGEKGKQKDISSKTTKNIASS